MRDPLHHDEELESFLHKQVANHRMYPSDQLWRSIQKELHGEGKWPALTYISIFIITALSVCTMMVKPEERLHKNTIAYPSVKEEAVTSAEKTPANDHNSVAAAAVQYGYAERMTQQTMQTVNEAVVAHIERKSANQPLVSLMKEPSVVIRAKGGDESAEAVPAQVAAKTGSVAKPAESPATVANSHSEDKTGVASSSLLLAAAKPASRYFSTIGLMNLSSLKKPSDGKSPSPVYNNDDIWRSYPVTNAGDLWRRKLSKFSFQFYITPSVSYRRLNDAHGKVAQAYSAIPQASAFKLDVNHVVEHEAQMGAEVGFALGYKLTNTLTAKSGFQFNVRQYGIKAYTMPSPQSPADAVANATPDKASSNPDEVTTDNAYLTSADKNSGTTSHPVVLSNRYYELSVPIGIDWRIASANNGRLTVNAAASLQPTYTFDKEPFAITTDYKNYAEGASIMRNWNLNSSVEAYVSYQMGAFRWQIGPQFRYQHFSTYSNIYPIREHLLDYGVKIGFTKSLD